MCLLPGPTNHLRGEVLRLEPSGKLGAGTLCLQPTSQNALAERDASITTRGELTDVSLPKHPGRTASTLPTAKLEHGPFLWNEESLS